MVYTKSKFKMHSTKYSHLNKSNPNIEMQIVEISKPNHKTILLVNTYRPPSGVQSDFLNESAQVLEETGGLRYHTYS